MEISRNKVHIAMWDDEAEMIEAALYVALELIEAYREEKADEAADNTPRWNAIIEAEGVLGRLHAKLADSKPLDHRHRSAAIQAELRKALAPIARLGGA